jgi:hypothetical protein
MLPPTRSENEAGGGITVEQAVAAFLAELKTRKAGESTIRKRELLLN